MCLTQDFCSIFIFDLKGIFILTMFKDNFDRKLALASIHTAISFDLVWTAISGSWVSDFWMKVRGQEIKYQSYQNWFLLFLSH